MSQIDGSPDLPPNSPSSEWEDYKRKMAERLGLQVLKQEEDEGENNA